MSERGPAVSPGLGERIASWMVLGWAVVRVALCATRSLDVQGVVALFILVTAFIPPTTGGRRRA